MILYLLLVVAFLFMAFVAPIKVTIGFVLLFAILGFVVKTVARMVTGNDPTFAEAIKAMIVAGIFQAIAAAALAKIAGGPLTGISAWVGTLIIFVAFVAGVALMLQATFKQSAVISLVSTLVSSVLIYGALKL